MLEKEKEYRRLRALGWEAGPAYDHAQTLEEWRKLEWNEGDNPKPNAVRLRIVPDEIDDWDFLLGDTYKPECHPDIPVSQIEREKTEYLEKIYRDGVWGIVGEIFNGEEWQTIDSCFGFVGEEWRDSGYDTDIMRACLEAVRPTPQNWLAL